MTTTYLPIMKIDRLIITAALAGLAFPTSASRLRGFFYGRDAAPGGHEWQSPDSLAYNKEQPRATFHYFGSIDEARRVLPEGNRYWMSLDGQWRFHWSKDPSVRPASFFKPGFDASGWDTIPVPSNWNIEGIKPDGSLRYGKPIYVNQKVIFQHQVKPGDWRGGVMRTPPESWTTFGDRNEVGSYLRTFRVPQSWRGREVYICFDGVDSFFYLWVNGHYVGFSKNSRNAARFDITPYLHEGDNTVAVEVYRNSDGSFLEAQDMFRLPGIFRSVSLYSTSKCQITDLVAMPSLLNDYKDGRLRVTARLRNLSESETRGCRMLYTLYANDLYSDDCSDTPVVEAESAPFAMLPASSDTITLDIDLAFPRKWSAEEPWRYTLVARLVDGNGRPLETVSTFTGFRSVELADVPAEKDEFNLAGRYFLINGKPVKLKGVNRHETSPSSGHTLSRSLMERDVMMMKRANINHVRNSHYPDDPYWYYLCDRYGIYLEDEANLESHEYYYGDASLSHDPAWLDAHVARDMELVHSTVNSPSVVIWSLGNEAGPGRNFVAAYDAIKKFDSSRPVQYERNNDIVDIGSNQYPSIEWTREAAAGKLDIKYPFHISEYAHSMGNALGGLADYWKAIESTNHLIGGAVWDWIDQSLYYYDCARPCVPYLAYGGDFGDVPSDGQFVMNGILFGDRTPKPQYHEVKKVYQNVAVMPVDMEKGEIEVFNKNYFTTLDDYQIGWRLLRDGVEVDAGRIELPAGVSVAPRSGMRLAIPYDYSALDSEGEYFVNVDFTLAADKPWAEAGYLQMSEQLPVKDASHAGSLPEGIRGNTPSLVSRDGFVDVTGDGFKASFNLSTGTLDTLRYGSSDIILPGKGPQLDAYRAYLNNDAWISDEWFAAGLYNLRHHVTDASVSVDEAGNPVLSFTVVSQAPNGGKMTGGNGTPKGVYSIDESESTPFGPDEFHFTTRQTWTVYPDGSLSLDADITSGNPELVLPRLGYTLEMPREFSNVKYYGRGPEENYSDRLTGQFVGCYSSTVDDMMTHYTRPQSSGNREEVRWAGLTDADGRGVLFVAPDRMSFSVSPYTESKLFFTDHDYRLPEPDKTVVHLDLGVTGLGGASCGQGGPLESQRIYSSPHSFRLLLHPVTRL